MEPFRNSPKTASLSICSDLAIAGNTQLCAWDRKLKFVFYIPYTAMPAIADITIKRIGDSFFLVKC